MAKSRNHSGQAVLIVLLSLSVVLIIAMYILSRSVTDISLSSKDEDSMRAFSAAEAGVERALIVGSTSDLNFGGARLDANVVDFAQGESQVVYPMSLKSGETAIFWFSRPDEISFVGDQMKVCWGDPDTLINDKTPAIEVTVYYTDKITRATLDPYPSRITTENNFDSALSDGCTINEEDFKFHEDIIFDDGILQFASVRILYNDTVSHKVGIDVSATTNSVLPSQGKKIDSSGSFLEANRKIEMYQLHPVIPPIFENAIFSATGVVK